MHTAPAQKSAVYTLTAMQVSFYSWQSGLNLVVDVWVGSILRQQVYGLISSALGIVFENGRSFLYMLVNIRVQPSTSIDVIDAAVLCNITHLDRTTGYCDELFLNTLYHSRVVRYRNYLQFIYINLKDVYIEAFLVMSSVDTAIL